MNKANKKLCLCCSGKKAELCCMRYLDHDKVAKTPEQLMRSRFTAFAMGGYGEYLIKTWFPATVPNISTAELSLSLRSWHSLEVIEKWQKGDTGMVEFKAYFKTKDSSDESISCHHECSSFKRSKGLWFYVGEEVS